MTRFQPSYRPFDDINRAYSLLQRAEVLLRGIDHKHPHIAHIRALRREIKAAWMDLFCLTYD